MIAQRMAVLAALFLVACTDLIGISKPGEVFVEQDCDRTKECRIEHPDVTIVIPPGALRQSRKIKIQPVTRTRRDGHDGTAYEFTPGDEIFLKPVTVEMRYTTDKPGIFWSRPETGDLDRVTKDDWDHLGGEVVSDADEVHATIVHLGLGYVDEGRDARTVVGIETVSRTTPTETSSPPCDNDLRTVAPPPQVFSRDGEPEEPGEGFDSGLFVIRDVDIDYDKRYWLFFRGEYHEASGSAIALNNTRLGQCEQKTEASVAGSNLVFNVGGLQGWTACAEGDKGDTLQVFSIDTDIWWLQAQAKAVTGKPGQDNPSLTNFTIDSFAGDAFGNKFLIEDGDVRLTQLAHPDGARHRALVRLLDSKVTQTDGTPVTVGGSAMIAVETPNTVSVRFDPGIPDLDKARFTVGLQPGALDHGTFSPRPDLLTIEDKVEAIERAGNMQYGNPGGDELKGTWTPYWSASWGARTYQLPGTSKAVEYLLNVVHGPVPSTSSTVDVEPLVSPVLAPTVDGRAVFSEDSSTGPHPQFAWQAPQSGLPDHYRVDVYLLDIVDGIAGCDVRTKITRSTRKASFRTVDHKTTSLTPPIGTFEAGKTYVVAITAVALGGPRSDGVLPQHHLPRGEASAMSGLFKP